MEEKIVYFDKPGKGDTPEVIQLVKERAQARGINQFVVASTRGSTARDFMEAVAGTDFRLVIVPWQYGFKGEEQPFPRDLVDELRAKNHQVHFGTMLFHHRVLWDKRSAGPGQSTKNVWPRNQGLSGDPFDGL